MTSGDHQASLSHELLGAAAAYEVSSKSTLFVSGFCHFYSLRFDIFLTNFISATGSESVRESCCEEWTARGSCESEGDNVSP